MNKIALVISLHVFTSGKIDLQLSFAQRNSAHGQAARGVFFCWFSFLKCAFVEF